MLTNTIVASQTVGIASIGSMVHADHTFWHNNGIDVDGTITRTNDITGPHQFMDYGDTYDAYHLSPTSAAIDAAIDIGFTTDIDQQARPFGDGFDIGADESTHIHSLIEHHGQVGGAYSQTMSLAPSPHEDALYAADAGIGLRVIDISAPTQPVEDRTYSLSSGVVNVTVPPEGREVYVTDNREWDGGLWIVDTSVPTAPTDVEMFAPKARDFVFDADGQMGYFVGEEGAGLHDGWLDVRNMDYYFSEGDENLPAFGSEAAIGPHGNFLFVANSEAGLQIVDVQDPANPFLVGEYLLPGSAVDVQLSNLGEFAYVIGAQNERPYLDGWLAIFDVHEPLTPTHLSTLI
jgi:hypothetical protein